MDIVWIIVTLFIGLAAGALLAYAVVTRRYGDRESVTELRNEFDEYQERVTKHFVETADLVNTLTRSYKNVYDHLEKGAYELVGKETLNKQLGSVDEAPVMIEYIGQRSSTESVARDEEKVAPKRSTEPTKTAGAVGSGGKAQGASGTSETRSSGEAREKSSETASDESPSNAEERTRSAG